MGFAESLTTKDNGKTWTLVLHPGLKFSDGTAFNAAAVAYNIARDANPATGSSLEADAAQLKTQVINATTLQITCTPANVQFPTLLSQEFAFIASPTAIKSEGKNFGANPVGPGPFKVSQNTYGVSWTFVRNSYYSIYAPGQPYLNSVKVVATQTPQEDIAALQTGQAELWRPQSQQNINLAKQAGLTVLANPQPEIGDLAFNTSKPPFNNVLAREAVYLALTPSNIASVWLPQNATPTNLFNTSSPYYNKQYNFPSPNAAKAQQLFNQLAAAGTPVKFSVMWPSVGGTVGNVGAYVTGAMSQFKNVTVTDDAVTGPQYTQQEDTGQFQMTATDLPSTLPGAFELFASGGAANFGKWSDPAVDAALAKIQSTTSPAELQQAWDTIQQQLNTQYPFIWVWRAAFGYAYPGNKVGGISLAQYGDVALFGPMYQK
jgi:peptide/nickel transport system substrate-binding protein